MAAPSEVITIDTFRQCCESALDTAITEQEATIRGSEESGNVYQTYETPAGLVIRRSIVAGIGSSLRVECDLSDMGEDAKERRIELSFPLDGEALPEITEEIETEDSFYKNTIARSRHDSVARELIRFVNMMY